MLTHNQTIALSLRRVCVGCDTGGLPLPPPAIPPLRPEHHR